MKLIAFVGPRGSGKDTCAAIAKEAGLVAGKISFAGPLKRICSVVFGIPLEVFEHPVKKEEAGEYVLNLTNLDSIYQGMRKYTPEIWPARQGLADAFANHLYRLLTSPRHVLQYVGTEVIRQYDENWHCRAAFSPLHLEQLGIDVGDGYTYAVTDCRFLNEMGFLSREHDTTFLYVERPEAEGKLAVATHESELEIRNVRQRISSVIRNDAGLDVLKQRVLEVLAHAGTAVPSPAARREGGL